MENPQNLVKAAKAGDIRALSSLLEQHLDFAFNLAYRVTKNRENAEDVVQEAYIITLNTIRSFKEESKFSTWLYRIVFRTALNHCKRQGIKQKAENEAALLRDEGFLPNAFEKLMESEKKQVLQEAISKLDVMEQSILLLYYFDEANMNEIAQITQLSESNVKVKLFRARKKLHDLLNETIKHY